MKSTDDIKLDVKIPADHRLVEITDDSVELYKILKFEGMASSGGEAKALIASGQVIVNHGVERQKRKRIVPGDVIEFDNDKIYIQLKAIVTNDIASKPECAESSSEDTLEKESSKIITDKPSINVQIKE
jgi:ribosome-associated protein|tara:strand:+ start:4058 stop:4444 length:387 start_codon:yes stop_codon:yes gene_type:complete